MITRVVKSNVHRKWFGTIELENDLVLYTSGSVASWFFEGDEVEVVPKAKPKDVLGRKTLFLTITIFSGFMRERRLKLGVFSKKR